MLVEINPNDPGHDGIDGSLPEVIVIHSRAPTDGSPTRAAEKTAQEAIFVARRISHGDARSDVGVIPSPIAGFVVTQDRKIPS